MSDRRPSGRGPFEQQNGHILFDALQLYSTRSTTELESVVTDAQELLRNIIEIFETTPSERGEYILQQARNLLAEQIEVSTVVGIYGQSGAGKTTLLNAVLRETALLPTSERAACTSVVTEVRYNEGICPYRGEIHFVPQDSWETTVRDLCYDIADNGLHIPASWSNDNGSAGLAYKQVQTAYPHLTAEVLKQAASTPEGIDLLVKDLRQRPNSALLGTVKVFEHELREDFKNECESYIGSRHGLWPLMKVVRLFLQCEALKRGVVLVDLPGLNDDNRAREQVCRDYIKQLDQVWIVTPIRRAKNDKLGKTLLGNDFKRQMQLDSGFASVTFVVSNIDLITVVGSRTDEGLQPGLDKELEPHYTQLAAFESTKVDLEQKIAELRITIKGRKERNGAVQNHLQGDQALKRKSVNQSLQPSKLPRLNLSQTPPRSQSQDVVDIDDIDPDVAPPVLLVNDPQKDLNDKRDEHDDIVEQIRSTKCKIRAICIAHSCEDVRKSIQHDFGQGLRDLDQETASVHNSHGPLDKKNRDYEKISKDLQVFCTSAWAVQQLEKQHKVEGLPDFMSTGIPALIDHCHGATDRARRAKCIGFLSELCQLLNHTWCSFECDAAGSDDNTAATAAELTNVIPSDLSKQEMHSVLDAVTKRATDSTQERLDTTLRKLGLAVTEATDEAPEVLAKWAGLMWNTYKAVVRKRGFHKSADGKDHDFNFEISEPLVGRIAESWQQNLVESIPELLKSIPGELTGRLNDLHEIRTEHAKRHGAKEYELRTLEVQNTNYQQILKQVFETSNATLGIEQKRIHREFKRVILERMLTAYENCSARSGRGMYALMKQDMADYIEDNGRAMYQSSAGNVRAMLGKLADLIFQPVIDKVNKVVDYMHRDFRGLKCMRGNAGPVQMSAEEHEIGRQVRDLLQDAKIFRVPTDSRPRSLSMLSHGGDGDEDMTDDLPIIKNEQPLITPGRAGSSKGDSRGDPIDVESYIKRQSTTPVCYSPGSQGEPIELD